MCLPNGNVHHYCQDAGSAMLSLFTPTPSSSALTAQTLHPPQSSASEHLRTLIVALRELDGTPIEAFFTWEKRCHHTLATLKARQAQMDASVAEIERHLFLVCTPAIEKRPARRCD